MADLIRVDHFRGFESYWAVPFGAETARAGVWQAGPGDAFFNAMNDALGRVPIVAENLGVITKKVEALRQRHGIPGMKVLQLELGSRKFQLDKIEENCVCYTGTHDNDTTHGWFHGSEYDTRTRKEFLETRENALRLTGGRPESIHRDLIRTAFASPARLAIAPMQDYLGLGSEARLNRPGTTTDNWRWRLSDGQLDSRVCESIRSLVEESSRQSSK
jgi:4-alpha-glucanotransferase